MYIFDKTYFPIIKIKLIGDINDNDLNNFLDEWRNLYKLNKYFIMIFYLDEINIPKLSYCYKMSLFINELRGEPPNLRKSIFIINNKIILRLLYFIFYLQSPISDIYIIDDDKYIDNILNNNLTNDIKFIKSKHIN